MCKVIHELLRLLIVLFTTKQKSGANAGLLIKFRGAGEGNVIPTHFVRGPLSLRCACSEPFVAARLCRVRFYHHMPKIKSAQDRLNFWCGRRESNPRLKLGKLSCCHYTTPAIVMNFISIQQNCPVEKI